MSAPSLPNLTGGGSSADSGSVGDTFFGKVVQVNSGATLSTILFFVGFGAYLWMSRKK